MSEQIYDNLRGPLELRNWICEHDQGILHQDVSVTIQPASFLYEPTAELQLTEYRIARVWKFKKTNKKSCFGGRDANGKPTITVFGGNQLPV